MVTLDDTSESRIAAELASAAAASPPGTRLPSVRDLTARHRASPLTVQRAIARLAADGIVVPRPGRGTFVAGPAVPPAVASAAAADLSWQEPALGGRSVDAGGLDDLLAAPPEGTIVLSTGYLESALQPTAALGAALARAARRPGSWDRLPPEGLPELRAWFATQAGGGLRAHDVVIAPGGQAAMGTAMRALAAAGDTLLVESPTYVGALAAARAAGLRVVPVPADADGVRPELLADALARTRARVFYCQPTWANPHGALLSPERRAAVLRAAAEHGAFVIEDDWARDFALDAEAPPPPAGRRRGRPRRPPAVADQGSRTGAADRRGGRARRRGRPAALRPAGRRPHGLRPAAAGRDRPSSPPPPGAAIAARFGSPCASAATPWSGRSPLTSRRAS